MNRGQLSCLGFGLLSMLSWASCVGSTEQDLGARMMGSVAVMGDSLTAAYNANSWTDDPTNCFQDQKQVSWAGGTQLNDPASVWQRVGGSVQNFAISGNNMYDAERQAANVKAWIASQPSPRLVLILLGHNDICKGGTVNKWNASCSNVERDPNNYCRTTNFYYEKYFRKALDILITIPAVRIGVVQPVRVSQLCNMKYEVARKTLFATSTCQGLWDGLRSAQNYIHGSGSGCCGSLTYDCSDTRIADAYNTQLRYRNIVQTVSNLYKRYPAGTKIPANSTYGSGNVVKAWGANITVTNALADLRFNFRDPFGRRNLSSCDCYHATKYAQNQIASIVWKGLTCSSTTPCCNDTVSGDTAVNRGKCLNVKTSGTVPGLWSSPVPAAPSYTWRMFAGQGRTPGQCLTSTDGRFNFCYQTDGNIVLYMGSTAIWNSGTIRSPGYLILHGIGTLSAYDAWGFVYWSTAAAGSNALFQIQNEGNAVLYNQSNAPIWWTSFGGY
jgi:lysophospholipase L1-like esterase